MSDAHDHHTDALDEGALLAAYLVGEIDDLTTRRLERRLADDAELAARLDALAATRGQLQRLAQVEMPADVRQRLKERLEQERATATPVGAPRPRRRWWNRGFAPIAVAAAVALVAVLGLASLGPLLVGGSEEGAAESTAMGEDTARDAAPPALSAPADEADAADEPATDDAEGDETVGAAGGRAETTEGTGDGVTRPPVAVEGDAQIAARAERLLENPPASLRTRERRLRRRAGLPVDPLCVRDLEAATVDLIDEDGRIALAVLVGGDAEQIVLLDPQTCAPIRTVSTGR